MNRMMAPPPPWYAKRVLYFVILIACGAVAPSGVLASSEEPSASRDLLQTSSSCPIVACSVSCVLDATNATWTCLRCKPGYTSSPDKTACYCPPGNKDNAGSSCIACGQDAFCVGGADNVHRGSALPCDATSSNGLTTRGATRARGPAQCYLRPGFKLLTPGSGTLSPTSAPCEANKYNSGNNRVTSCTSCPPGTTVEAGKGFSRRSCAIAAGYQLSNGRVVPCPAGTYREGAIFLEADITIISQSCLACGAGITTGGPSCTAAGTACTSRAACDRVVPGYGASSTNGSIILTAQLCPIGSYNPGGPGSITCRSCISGTTTQTTGTPRVTSCLVPPGYYSTAAGLTPCPDGSFRGGWAAKPLAAACTACNGTWPPTESDSLTIKSEPRDTLDHPSYGPFVRGSEDSCYIEPGQGMVRINNAWSKIAPCPQGTFGVFQKTYGLKMSPCTPCLTGQVTGLVTSDPSSGYTSAAACYSMAGWGLTADGLTYTACPADTYTPSAYNGRCIPCDANRYTAAGGSQAAKLDCLVKPGFGLYVDSEPLMSLEGLGGAAPADAEALECPPGSYGVGGAVDSLCVECRAGSYTLENGLATSAAACITDCPAGTELSSGSCRPCSSPTWNNGDYPTCQTCPAFTAYYDGKADTLSAGAASPPHAVAFEQCLPEHQQTEQGYAIANVSALSNLGTKASIDACASTCGADCQFFTYVYSSMSFAAAAGTCYIKPAAAAVSGAVISNRKLYYRLPTSQALTGASVASAVAAQAAAGASVSIASVAVSSLSRSGAWYLKWDMAVNETEIGVNLPSTTAATLEECLSTCEYNTATAGPCLLAYYDSSAAAGVKCLLKTGVRGPEEVMQRTAVHVLSSHLVQGAAAGEDGSTCTAHVGCQSGHCGSGVCRPAQCYNLAMDGDESAIDCGGPCEPC